MKISKSTLLLFLVPLLATCQPKEKFEWDAGLSAPKFYSSSPTVIFFYKGKPVGGASSNIGIQPGWGEPSGGYAGGSKYKEVPDSLYVEWLCGNDRYNYKGAFELPREKMLALFREPVTAFNGLEYPYSLIIVGTAPGGNVTVWMRAINVLTEVAKFKAKNDGIWKEDDEEFNQHRKEIKTSKEFVNSDYNTFHYLHGIPYEVWEKGEKKYDYDIAFTSEDNKIKLSSAIFYTKSGYTFQPDTFSEAQVTIDVVDWLSKKPLPNNNVVKDIHLPVQIKLRLEKANDETQSFTTNIVLPNDFEETFRKGYKDPASGKQEPYNRMLIGSYAGGRKGVIWLIGKNIKTKLMEFKAFYRHDPEYIINIGGYSLPKNFKFPKWEGREKLIPPDIEFWREE